MADHETGVRVMQLRQIFQSRGLDGFIVPMADEYQNEYVPPSARRVEFLSGFTGSAGSVIVLSDKAAFFTDARYTLQAAQQIAGDVFETHDSATTSPGDWLTRNLKNGARLGYDPWLHSDAGVERLQKAVTKVGAELVPVAENPVDAAWPDRPPAPCGPIVPHDLVYAGKASVEKRAEVAATLNKAEVEAAVISDPASVAWLLNVRGSDVPHTPLPLSFALLQDDGSVDWFVEPRKVTAQTLAHLDDGIRLHAPDDFAPALDELGRKQARVRVDRAGCANWMVERLRRAGARLDEGDDPCELPKACKNAIELTGMRAAHRRDGVALTKFLAWLSRQISQGAAITEMDAEKALYDFRAQNELFRDLSFDTISGAGPNGAIVHYRATAATNRKLEQGTLYLVDSGAQYLDGTTDVTRTVAIGQPTEEMRDRFTRVLKGHIALANLRFPAGTTGADIDVLARRALWAGGIDYNHSTGHGVGCYLGVHEGPQGISRRAETKLQEGMILSNEPGYYKAGHYGIRIENLMAVTAAEEIEGGEQKMMGFETLTLAPVDRRLIKTDMLTAEETGWLDAYHRRVAEVVTPQLDAVTREWLCAVTSPLT